MEIADIEVRLKPSQNFFENQRTIEVDVNSRVSPHSYALDSKFSFNQNAFTNVRLDDAKPGRIVLTLSNEVTLNDLDDEIAVTYYARSENGNSVSGKIVFPEVEFEISAKPVEIELDDPCCLPDKIVVNVRDHHGGRPVTLTGIGSTNSSAATVTLIDLTGSDYNDDFNDNFGMTPGKVIDYTLNKATTFWKTRAALDMFTYTISYKGRTASNSITIKLSDRLRAALNTAN